uniref:Core shell protein Gag P30 domain-containing protein n=1 Tax=Anas platyrhynchos platyrhynchos TaxID=8840 RepID=A0A493SVC5_ANAPP
MLFLRREGKWDEVSYADMFFTLRNHPEWQKECGINLAPQDPLILSIEKDMRRDGVGKLKRCCSACSIGQRCLKLNEPEERMEDYVLPPINGDVGAGIEVEGAGNDIDSKGFTPITARTRSKIRPIIQAPLRQAMGANGPARIKVPFTTNELDAWKEAVKGYRDDPEVVAKRFELIVKNLDPDWKDIEIMLAALSETEKQLIVKTARTQVQIQVASGALPGTVEVHVPRADPNWDYNDENDYKMLKRYQEWIRIALENAIPKSVNWSRLYTIKQGTSETPSEFLERLRAAMQKFTTIDPSSEGGKLQLVSLFLGQSAEDIRRKLQKMKEPDIRDLERLVEEAWRVFRNREGNERQKLGE